MDRLSRILVVDDNPYDVELTMAALSECNLANAVDVVGDGAEALEYLFCRGVYADRQSGLPVVILLDLKLPLVDGLEVLRAIKSDEKLRVVPTVILTSSREEKDLAEGYNLGVNAYIVKPVEFGAFIKAVSELGSFWAIMNEVPGRLVKGQK